MAVKPDKRDKAGALAAKLAAKVSDGKTDHADACAQVAKEAGVTIDVARTAVERAVERHETQSGEPGINV